MPRKPFNLYSTVKTENPKFKKMLGKPQMSYSAYTSWTEPQYRGEFIAQKFLGFEIPAGIFADFGTACGEFLETNGEVVHELLSQSDIDILRKIERPEGSEYEREVLIDRGKYCIIGYIDRCTILDDASLHVRDYKTGAEKKKEFYGSDDYQQTNLYSYGLEVTEGEVVSKADVELLHRKGNTVEKGHKNVLRLTGGTDIVPTPYTKERAEKFLKKMDKVAGEISDFHYFYNKFFVNE